MTHVITSLCVRENGCVDVCPVECIRPGAPVEKWPTYYIDPATCIDCGACIPECPYSAIFPEDDVPASYRAVGGELINSPGLRGHFEGLGHHGEKVVLETVRSLTPGEIIDLRDAIDINRSFFK